MPRKTGAQVAEKWLRNTQAAAKDYEDGVNAVQENPMAKAATMLDLAKQNYSEAIDSGRMAAALNAVSTQDWKTACTGKGKQRHSQGVAAAKPKAERVFTKLIQAVYEVQASLPPRGSFEENMARAYEQARGMKARKGSFKK